MSISKAANEFTRLKYKKDAVFREAVTSQKLLLVYLRGTDLHRDTSSSRETTNLHD